MSSPPNPQAENKAAQPAQVGNAAKPSEDTKQSITLVIANKRYSSWSLRPWFYLRMNEIAFKEDRVSLYVGDYKKHLLHFSPAGKAPILVIDSPSTEAPSSAAAASTKAPERVCVWDSIAICEFVAEQLNPRYGWPKDKLLRAEARSICAEMHSGFMSLREECSMNVARAVNRKKLSDGAKGDVSRIAQMWTTCLRRSGGPFLYGEFTIADAMYAPVTLRFDRYDLLYSDNMDASLSIDLDLVKGYVKHILSLVPIQEWVAAGRAETDLLAHYENA